MDRKAWRTRKRKMIEKAADDNYIRTGIGTKFTSRERKHIAGTIRRIRKLRRTGRKPIIQRSADVFFDHRGRLETNAAQLVGRAIAHKFRYGH